MNEEGLGQAIHAAAHYENFPVASWLLPPAMRAPVLALYRFARAGDDVADEGIQTASERLAGLDQLAEGLRLGLQAVTPPSALDRTQAEAGSQASRIGLGEQLGRALALHGLDPQPAFALLEAFRYDAAFRPFEDWEDVTAYCERSANPIGQLMLGFAGLDLCGPLDRLNPLAREIRVCSDAICTGLQLVNFAQDLHEDLARGRPTLPRSDWPANWQWLQPADDVRPEGFQPSQAACGRFASADGDPADLDPAERRRISLSIVRRGLDQLSIGRRLPALLRRHLPQGRLRLPIEIALTQLGGQAMGRAIVAEPEIPWHRSLRLSKWRLIGMIPKALSLSLKPLE